MPAYAIHRRPPRTMTELEQAKLLKVTGEHARGFRDHVLFALALGTGLREQLLAAMREERLFLDPDLTLAHLASHLGMSTNHLSQVINSQCQQNFGEFLAQYRVEEAKRLLRGAHSGQAAVLQVALEAGFRSKSAFYAAFKRYTRMTPREYLDAQR